MKAKKMRAAIRPSTPAAIIWPQSAENLKTKVSKPNRRHARGHAVPGVTGWCMAATMLKAVDLNRQVVIVLALPMVTLGTCSLGTHVLDVAVAMVAGGIGYLMLRYGYSTTAATLAVSLGSEFERNRIGLNFVGFFSPRSPRRSWR
jgi:hypothetical protein